MKDKRPTIKQRISDRISEEMKRNKQTNEVIAEQLGICPEHFSRLRSGKYKLSKDKAEKLALMWDVTPDYVLGISDCRTFEEAFQKDSSEEIAKYKAVTDLLKIMGYGIDIVELLVITPGEIAAMQDPDKEIKAIEPFIIETGELWPVVKKSAYNAWHGQIAQYSETVFCFEVSNGYIDEWEEHEAQREKKTIEYIDKLKEHETHCESLIDYIEEIIDNTEIGDYIDFYARITKDGRLIGYSKDYRSLFKIISKNAASLFGTLLSVYSNEIVKNKDINLNPSTDLPFS